MKKKTIHGWLCVLSLALGLVFPWSLEGFALLAFGVYHEKKWLDIAWREFSDD
jgi:hypothetical protein